MRDKNEKDTAYYLGLPYTFILRRDEDGDVVARIEELPGCTAHGNDESEAMARVKEAQRLWIEDSLETGDPVPEPQPEETLPSGKWVQRVSRSLHKKLVDLAKREEVSLNQLVTSMLAEAVGRRSLVLSCMAPFTGLIWSSQEAEEWDEVRLWSGEWKLERSAQHQNLLETLQNVKYIVGRPVAGHTRHSHGFITKTEEIEHCPHPR